MLDDFGRGYQKALKECNMSQGISLGCCDPVPMECTQAQPKKKEKNMNRVNIEDISVSIEAKAEQTDERQREYLEGRLGYVYSDKLGTLRKKFALDDDDAPTTAKELVDRITAGKYILPSDEDQKKMTYWGYGTMRQITWRDPTVKEDQAGYDAAREILDKMFSDAKDDIRIQAPADGLKTLRAFRDATIQ